MIKLHSNRLDALNKHSFDIYIGRVSRNPNRLQLLAKKEIFVVDDVNHVPKGFFAYLFFDKPVKNPPVNSFYLPKDFKYLLDGDIIRLNANYAQIRVLYRIESRTNSLLITERCNNYCLMCSQPPKPKDDSYIIDELLSMIPLMDKSTEEIGITGGEPTLTGDGFFDVIKCIKNSLPTTSLHILSNGRKFKDPDLARRLAAIKHHDLMVGIPLYSDISDIHDYVVQADCAYDDTLRGILQLKTYGVKVEIRVVIHKGTYQRLPQLAEFIARNLLFVDHVALMGLEMMGFTKANMDSLWIDPVEYQQELFEAVSTLSNYKINTSIYNHQLCLLDPRLEEWNRKSISDWKNKYMDECEGCNRKNECGGFFSSAKIQYSNHIKPFK
jgi:His-Xaa-Ser system radical SAM maturase HxsC